MSEKSNHTLWIVAATLIGGLFSGIFVRQTTFVVVPARDSEETVSLTVREASKRIEHLEQELQLAMTEVSSLKKTRADHGPGTAGEDEPLRENVVRAEEFEFVLKGCSQAGVVVRCAFSVKNHARDRLLTLFAQDVKPRSRLFDLENTETFANQARLGKEQGKYARLLLLAGSTVDASLSFEGVSPGATGIAMLEVSYGADRASGSGSTIDTFKLRGIEF